MSQKPTVLVIDDESGILDTLRILLRKEGFEVATAQGGKAGLEAIKAGTHDIVLTDVRMPQVSGLDILTAAREQDPMTPVILMTAQASLQTAISAVNAGAYYYIQKPFANDELVAILRRACEYRAVRVENKQLRQEIKRRDRAGVTRPIGKSRSFMDVMKLAEQVSPTESTVLIQGESGTGKEVIARYLHNLSARNEGPFLSINCGALPENLLESELFGHVKGSFTGAVRDKQGLFAAARGGSFFLDEVGEMPPPLQVKLLRVLQEREAIPVGATEAIPVDVRIIAATNRDLEEEARHGRFRSDLFYRLNVITIHLPPLRDRREDILLLVENTMQRLASEQTSGPKALSAEALDAVMVYDWPGNVRELENALEHAWVLSRGDMIEPATLPERITRRRKEPLVAERAYPNPTLEVIERAYIMYVLQAEGGNKTRAAEVLGIDPSTLYRKLSRYEETTPPMTGAARDDSWRWYAVVALTALLGSVTSLGNRFAQDDIPVIVDNPRLHSLAAFWHRFAESYWPPEVAAVLYRPVSATAFTIQWVLGDGSPWLFHLTSILLLIGIAWLTLACLRQLLPAPVAGLAALLFAAHPVHVESVGNVSGQSELWAAGFVMAAVLLYLQTRMSGRSLSPARWAAIVAIGGLAVFSKEHGAVLIGLLFAAECTVVTEPRGVAARVRALWPGYAALALVVAGYLAARTAVLGSVVGEVAHIVLRDAGPWQRILTMLAVVPEWLRLLFFPAHLQSDYMPQELSIATGFGPDQALGAVLIVIALLLAGRAWRSAPAVTLGILWIGIALFPVSNLLVSTGVLLAERTLFLPSAGAVLMLGGALTWWRRASKPLSFRAAVVVTALLALLVIAGTLRSALRQPIWRDNPTLFAQAVEDAPFSYTAHWALAGVLYRSGLQHQAELHYRLALEFYNRDANLHEDFGDRFLEHGLCTQAAQFMRQALAEMPGKWKARSKLIFCLLRLDSLPAAQAELALKRERGEPDVDLVSQAVDSVLRSRAPAAP